MSNSNHAAQAEQEAKEKAEQFKNKDPFPDIPCALLNSADIADYIETTGMVFPFYKDKLKSASYEVAISGAVVYWEPGRRNPRKRDLALEKKHQTFQLKPNSIAFIEIEPTFRLPNYMAMRFNLKITHVYRGLLLGTGPLVDPGFEGKIYIPLHNLTSNTYTFSHGEDLIWVEFTKISQNSSWQGDGEGMQRAGQYVPFPANKQEQPLDYYFEKANKGGAIASSIPQSVERAEKAAKAAHKWVRVVGGIGVLSFLLFILGVAYVVYDSWQTQRDYVDKSEALLENGFSDLARRQDDQNAALQQQIDLLRQQVERMEDSQAGDAASR